MRVLFFVAIVLLFELCTFFVAKGLGWLCCPKSPQAAKWILIGSFVVSNLFLAGLLFGAFRLTLSYLAVLWIAVLSMILTLGAGVVLGKLGIGSPVGLRAFAVLSFVGLLGLAVFNAYVPTVRHLTVQVDKPMPTNVRLAVASDLHLGALFGKRELERLAGILAENQVDLLLMPGDIMDDNVKAYTAKQMQASFAKVVHSTTHGAVASLGNHDLYQQDAYQSIIDAIVQTDAILLDDKSTTIAIEKDGQRVELSLIGRFDDHYHQRKTTQDLFNGLTIKQQQNPVILLDHRPSQIDENSQLPIDLQVSGHTHNGQVFPANFIVQAINTVGYGFKIVNKMPVVVSSGYGFWGIPLRLGSRSEVWVIDLVGRRGATS